MPLPREKVLKWLDDYKKIVRPTDDAHKFYIANIQIQLGNFEEARQLYRLSILTMIGPRPLWEMVSEPDWLVNIWILSGRFDLFPQIQQQLIPYQSDYRGDSVVALYAYTLLDMLYPFGMEKEANIQKLLSKQKVKLSVALGLPLQAILKRDQAGFNDGLSNLLDVHKGMATRGVLRTTAEGLLCMPAMALSYVAKKVGLAIEMESPYLIKEYLDFIESF